MLGAPELIAILIAALFLFGPQKLPELARSLGGAIGEFKKAQRAAEMELTQFDAYTQRSENIFSLKAKEEDRGKLETDPKQEANLQEKEENKEKKT